MRSDQFIFVICTERGILEKYSLMLVESIRRFGGIFSDVNIISYSPRKGRIPKNSTLKRFEKLKVKCCTQSFNIKYFDYPFANKVLACQRASMDYSGKTIVFLDSDQLFLSEPTFLLKCQAGNVILSAPEKVGVAFNEKKPTYKDYWEKLYLLFAVSNKLSTVTKLSNEKINGYWNAGFIVGPSAFYQNWFAIFSLLMEKKMFPKGNKTFMDQVSMAVTICTSYQESFLELPLEYNYPIDGEALSLDGIVSLHYHKSFLGNIRQSPFIKYKTNSIVSDWIGEKLKEHKLFPQPPVAKLKNYLYQLINKRKI